MEYFTNKYKTNNEKEFYVNHNQLGAPTSPQTANQLQEATSRLNAGLKNVELSLISPDVFESIPKQHFEEVRRLGELTGSKASLHFPAQIDLAGFKGGQQGVAWSERERKQAEKNLLTETYIKVRLPLSQKFDQLYINIIYKYYIYK